MRQALRNLSPSDYWIYGPTVAEFAAVIDFVQRQCDNTGQSLAINLRAHATADDPTGVSSDAAEDLVYYAELDREMMWSFAIWRLQGLFEALIVREFVAPRHTHRLIGLQTKLAGVKASGFHIHSAHETELLEWAKLRNVLSHTPAETYRPITLSRQDAEDYRQLLETVCASLQEQALARNRDGA